ALTIAASMVLSAVNAMTMTPARAASIFKDPKPGQSHEQHREALPWWSFGILGGLLVLWLLAPLVDARLHLVEQGGLTGIWLKVLTYAAYAVLFLPGAVVGGAIGWFAIRPVNWVLGWVFRGFNWGFDKLTAVYGQTVGWALRLSVIVLFVYVGLLGLTYFGF